jgi:dTDP-4-dehydrorhamnose 3,5-epimerase
MLSAETITEAAQAAGIAGVRVIPLRMNRDDRGHVTELFGALWPETAGFAPQQWHMLASRAGTLRGMHLHLRHDDLKIVVEGRVAFGLRDLRRGSPTEGRSRLLALSGDEYAAVLIPAGVAHGILSHTDSLVLVGVTQPYDGTDEFECAWDDPELGIEWPAEPTIISERDRSAGSLAALRVHLQ